MPAKLPLEWSNQAARDMRAIERGGATGERAITAILNAALLLTDHPRLGRIGRIDNTRELVVPGFPYLMVYRISARRLFIVGVVHQSRKYP